LLQNEHDILNRLLMNEGLPPRIGELGARMGAAGYYGAGRRLQPGVIANEVDPNIESGHFLQ